jgi:hypothetical protein
MYRTPTLTLLDKVHEKLVKLVKRLTRKIYDRFPEVEAVVHDIIMEDLAAKKETTKMTLEAFLECNECYLFTNDADFMRRAIEEDKGIEGGSQSKKKEAYVDGNTALINTMRIRIDNYFYVCSRNLRDTAPKIIGNFLIKALMNDIHFVLFNSVANREGVIDSFSEPKSKISERESLEKMVSVLRAAEKKLISDPMLSTSRYDSVDIYEEISKQNQSFLEQTRGRHQVEQRTAKNLLDVNQQRHQQAANQNRNASRSVSRSTSRKRQQQAQGHNSGGKPGPQTANRNPNQIPVGNQPALPGGNFGNFDFKSGQSQNQNREFQHFGNAGQGSQPRVSNAPNSNFDQFNQFNQGQAQPQQGTGYRQQEANFFGQSNASQSQGNLGRQAQNQAGGKDKKNNLFG